MDLFAESENKNFAAAAPLAVRMRPRTLDEFVGQESFIGKGKLLWRMLEADRLTSLIFFGSPGSGKTTLANIIARQSTADFVPANAATIGVAQIRKIMQAARDTLAVDGRKTVLFLDEIHRFSRSQQDVLLDDVENGTIVLIGATTENPSFTVNSALVSRSTIFEFKPLEESDIINVIQMALKDTQRGLGKYTVEISPEALEYLALMSDGDARRALNALDVGVLSQVHSSGDTICFDLALAKESIQKRTMAHDPSGDSHYDLASALQKSMRGSDPDATVYYLARLIVGGEDPRFIARRIAVTAAEDVGNADPMATVLAASAMQISELVGFPEAQLPLAQAALYIACAPKSNSSAQAIWSACSDVNNSIKVSVPDFLRDSYYKSAKKLGRGQGYKNPHEFTGGFVSQEYLPKEINRQYYAPADRGREKQIKSYLAQLKRVMGKL